MRSHTRSVNLSQYIDVGAINLRESKMHGKYLSPLYTVRYAGNATRDFRFGVRSYEIANSISIVTREVVQESEDFSGICVLIVDARLMVTPDTVPVSSRSICS